MSEPRDFEYKSGDLEEKELNRQWRNEFLTASTTTMRYYVEIKSLTEVIAHAVDKRELTKWLNEHPNALYIDEKEYKRLIK